MVKDKNEITELIEEYSHRGPTHKKKCGKSIQSDASKFIRMRNL